MRIAVASSSPVGIPVLQALLSSEHEVGYVLTNPDKATGRGLKVEQNEFAEYAANQGLAVLKPNTKSEISVEVAQNLVDLVVTVAYGQLIPNEALTIPKFGWLNIHFSQLPKWRGAAPVQYAIMNQDESIGISIFKLDEGLDTGPIYFSKEIRLSGNETTTLLLNSLSNSAGVEIAELISKIEQGLAPVPQSENGASFAPKIAKTQGHMELNQPSAHILAKVRALGDNPGVYVMFRGERIRINKASSLLPEDIATETASRIPSEIGSAFATKSELFARTIDGIIKFDLVTPQGKKQMSGADFARGARIDSGDKFE